MKKLVLDVENLRIQFQTQAEKKEIVHGISFSVEKGKITALVGESGSGKSVTALSILHLLNKNGCMQCDRMILNGQDITNMKPRKRYLYCGSQVGMIFQDPLNSLDPLMRAGDSVCEAAQAHMKGMNKREIRRKAQLLLESMRMSNAEQVMKQYPHELSGGMCQRIMIATAMILNPPLLIADEPTTALDVTIQAQILDEIEKVCRKFQTGVLFITHDLSLVAEIADTVYVMKEGTIVEKGSVAEVFTKPQHEYTKMLLEAAL